jgi:hypothetical protein
MAYRLVSQPARCRSGAEAAALAWLERALAYEAWLDTLRGPRPDLAAAA